jgi:Type VI secretion system VasI, EvfG, VC_A0118
MFRQLYVSVALIAATVVALQSCTSMPIARTEQQGNPTVRTARVIHRSRRPHLWRVSEQTNSNDGSQTVVVSSDAETRISRDSSISKTPIAIQCVEHETSVLVWTGVPAAPTPGSDPEYRVQYRLDSHRSKTEQWKPTTYGDGLEVSGQRAVALARRLAHARVLKFRFTPLDSEPTTVTFNLNGLQRVLPKVQHACDWGGASAFD